MIGRGGSWTRVMYMCSTLKAPPHRHTHWHSTTVTNPNYNYCLQAVFPRQPAQSQLERKRGRLPCTRSHARLPHGWFPIRSNKMCKLDTRCSIVKDLLHVQEKVNASSSAWCESLPLIRGGQWPESSYTLWCDHMKHVWLPNPIQPYLGKLLLIKGLEDYFSMCYPHSQSVALGVIFHNHDSGDSFHSFCWIIF